MLRTSPASFIATEVIPAGARVKFTAGSAMHIELADSGDVEIGTALLHNGKSSYAIGDAVGVALTSQPGTRTCLAFSSFAVGATVKRADNGYVDDAGAGDNYGIALEASTGLGDFVEVLSVAALLTTVADAAVTAAKLATGAVTAVKLADAVADAIPTVTVAVANQGSPNGTATVTIQAKDAQGNNLAARTLVRGWFSATSYGAATDLGTLTATTGVLVKEDTDDALFTAATDANGLLVLSYDMVADGNLFCMASGVGLLVAGNVAVTGN